MAYLRPPHPWRAGYSMPQNALDEPPVRGAIVSKYRKRKSIDGPLRNPREPAGYLLPQSVRDEPLGQGVRTTHYRRRRTVYGAIPRLLVTGPAAGQGLGSLGGTPGGIFGGKRGGSHGVLSGHSLSGNTLESRGYGSLGAATSTVQATLVTPKLTSLIKVERGAAVPVQGLAWQKAQAENEKIALKVAQMITDEVFLLVPSNTKDFDKKRRVVVRAIMTALDPSYWPRVEAIDRTLTQTPRDHRWKLGRALQIFFKQASDEDIATLASGRPLGTPASFIASSPGTSITYGGGGGTGPTYGGGGGGITYKQGASGLGDWKSWVKKHATWSLVGYAILGPAGAILGAVWPDAPKYLYDGMKKVVLKIKEIYCKYWQSGIPQMAAQSYATAQGGPQAAQATQQVSMLVDQVCAPSAETLPMGPPEESKFPLVPVLIGGGLLLAVIFLKR